MTDADTIIRRELGHSEQLLWNGPARTGILLQAGDWFVVPAMVIWCGVVATMLVANVVEWSVDSWVTIVMAAAFLLIGLYFAAGRFLFDARRRGRTQYAVTSERVIITTRLSSETVTSVYLDRLTDVTLTERANGSGSIFFGPRPPWHTGQDLPGTGLPRLPQLELAADARRVYEIVLAARRALKQGT